MQQRATPYTPRNGSKVERATLTNVTACSPSRDTGPADQVFFRTRRPPRRRELILKGMRTQRCTDATVRLQVDSASTGHQRQMTCQGPQTAPASEKRTEEGASISSGLCGESLPTAPTADDFTLFMRSPDLSRRTRCERVRGWCLKTPVLGLWLVDSVTGSREGVHRRVLHVGLPVYPAGDYDLPLSPHPHT